MSSPPPAAILCGVFLLVFSAVAAVGDEPTAYEVMGEYDFPAGLLPKGVTSYEIDYSTGQFKVYLNGTCTFTIDGYKLRYKSTITGVITKDRLKNLKGISVYFLLFWVNIVEVTRDGSDLDFSVGIASASFEVSNFFESPQCGCGFDCVNEIVEAQDTKLNEKGLLSSL